MLTFHLLERGTSPPDRAHGQVYLQIDNWNDYSFETFFYVYLFDLRGTRHDLGGVKIAFKGQTANITTSSVLETTFSSLGEGYFSLGQGTSYYKALSQVPDAVKNYYLDALQDLVKKPTLMEKIREERVFGTSLLRSYTISEIKGKFHRVLNGEAELTNYTFRYYHSEEDLFGKMDVSFKVEVDAKPNTNIHALIGRNGVGKTTLLNGIINTICRPQESKGILIDEANLVEQPIGSDYFSNLVSVSFSAFDPFSPPSEQPDPAKGTCYFYIGLKDPQSSDSHRGIQDLLDDCVTALLTCFQDEMKTKRWLTAIEGLCSDQNFSSMNLDFLRDQFQQTMQEVRENTGPRYDEIFREKVIPTLRRMSSGHAIVLLTITRLVATVTEKTLVLLDEPESHLHAPLLSAFIRVLSDLLLQQNGVAIIATHSPVVLQEVPRKCVWKIYRYGKEISFDRPAIETFGENVGILTREVFKLEIEKSGFHALLQKEVDQNHSYNAILEKFDNQLGLEGRSILQAMIVNKKNPF
ncbi:AAA family ATPase [Kordiimonas sp. SCSIO 12603]|uniref:AAA family ATPase n=1 Tax=Kordiimonas sp. SCSIO 12603 TaxID=2829596 RepID=UPI002106A401|nr:AAA family ATPase [Kordiimonas sp. SCSIO 12603]UTW59652.1 AAA family ATPase [Kordiimonas sp. SCSIO 12603]